MSLRQVLKQLRGERSRTQKELSRLDDAIAAFEKLVGANGRRKVRGIPRAKRRFSVATRRKMAEAQKARWAKLRREKKAAA